MHMSRLQKSEGNVRFADVELGPKYQYNYVRFIVVNLY